MNNTTLKKTIQLLKINNLHAIKKFGQNFLIDQNIIDKIVNESFVDHDTCVIEIGPGLGALTKTLVEKAGKVIAFEIDKKLIPILEERFADKSNFKVINQNFLNVEINELLVKLKKDYKKIKVIANLPYYITSQAVVKILSAKTKVNSCTLMMQKELAERLTASVSTKKYNNFSILIQHFSKPKIIFHVPPKVFIPEPKVISSVVYFKIKKQRIYIENEDKFFLFLKQMFAQKRKTILNNLGNYTNDKVYAKEILTKINIDTKFRPENITIKDFVRIYNEITS